MKQCQQFCHMSTLAKKSHVSNHFSWCTSEAESAVLPYVTAPNQTNELHASATYIATRMKYIVDNDVKLQTDR